MKYLILFICLIACHNNELREYPEEEASGGKFDYTCPDAVYPNWKTSKYVLPYPVGLTYLVKLSNCSASYHSAGKPDQFAVDFAMDIGTLITASRGGEVIAVEEAGRDYDRAHNNYVIIDHKDGTYGYYMHLTHQGAIVKIGDTVTKGDSIGYAGATGLAGYPHLHLVIVKDNYSWPYESIPLNFRNTSKNERGLSSNTAYKALAY